MDEFQQEKEKFWAVKLMHRMEMVQDWLTIGPLRRGIRHLSGGTTWPVVKGAFAVGDREGPVAICTLTSNDLVEPFAHIPGVAIAGRVYTANLGLEKIILNVVSNPSIRYLVICGKDSPLFLPGQTLQALWLHGTTSRGRVIAAKGHMPVLVNVKSQQIECFRRQVEVISLIGETNLVTIASRVEALVQKNPGTFPEECDQSSEFLPNNVGEQDGFVELKPGGHREPLAYDSKGFFVITIDRQAGDIVIRHYLPDQTPAHLMHGRSAEAILLGLIRADLISQISHAGYLGSELTKAEAALKFGFIYEQDQPLRKRVGSRESDVT